MTAGGQLAFFEEALGRPRVLLVHARFGGLDIARRIPGRLFLGPQSQDLTQRLELLFAVARFGEEIGLCTQDFYVLRREIERPTVKGVRLSSCPRPRCARAAVDSAHDESGTAASSRSIHRAAAW